MKNVSMVLIDQRKEEGSRDVQRACQPNDANEGQVAEADLDLRNVRSVQLGFFRQPLLAPAFGGPELFHSPAKLALDARVIDHTSNGAAKRAILR